MSLAVAAELRAMVGAAVAISVRRSGGDDNNSGEAAQRRGGWCEALGGDSGARLVMAAAVVDGAVAMVSITLAGEYHFSQAGLDLWYYL